jgi:uroporphyrinogen-III synthase
MTAAGRDLRSAGSVIRERSRANRRQRTPGTLIAVIVAVTRDEPPDGPLSTALREYGLAPVACPVLVEGPPADPAALQDAALTLEQYDWVVVASARSVRALSRARGEPWPPQIRTAAVGGATAAALAEAGVAHPTLVAPAEGAEALLTLLEDVDWVARRVLVPTTSGGRRLLAEHLRAAWAIVDEVEAYAMHPRAPRDIDADWQAAAPDAAVVASPRAAELLAAAVGLESMRALQVVVAIGAATAAALAGLGVASLTPPHADFRDAARRLAERRDGRRR